MRRTSTINWFIWKFEIISKSLSRSIKKAEKALPFSTTKKKEVINGLAKRYQLIIQYKEKRKPKPDMLKEEEQEWLVNVFDRPGIIYKSMLGKKMGKENRFKIVIFCGHYGICWTL